VVVCSPGINSGIEHELKTIYGLDGDQSSQPILVFEDWLMARNSTLETPATAPKDEHIYVCSVSGAFALNEIRRGVALLA
jgi:hypothetical protein